MLPRLCLLEEALPSRLCSPVDLVPRVERESLWCLVSRRFVSPLRRWTDIVAADTASATQGHVGLRAYRLTPSFIEAYRVGKFDTQRYVPNS